MWIESHLTLPDHPKTRRLARLLAIDIPTTMGHLHLLWYWAVSYAADGDTTRYDASDIADACRWPGDPDTLVTALVASEFMDLTTENRRVIHKWDAYAGRLIEQRRINAERKRESRRVASGVRPPDIHAPSDARPAYVAGYPAQQYKTVPDITGPDITGPDERANGQVTAGAVPKARGQRASARKAEPVVMLDLTPEQMAKLVQDFGAELGGEEATREMIGLAMEWRNQRGEYPNPWLYVRGWLRRNAAWRAAGGNGHGPNAAPSRTVRNRVSVTERDELATGGESINASWSQSQQS